MEVCNKLKQGSLIRNYKLDLVNKVVAAASKHVYLCFCFWNIFNMKLLTIMYLLPETGAFLQRSVRVFTFLILKNHVRTIFVRL